MAQAARLSLRLQKELKLLLTDPPPSASFPFLSSDSDLSSLSLIHAQIHGPEGTVYADGVFNIKIQIPERYPFHPPIVTFLTPIYHPNIDNGGRICLDILNLPPKGAWQPSLNISTVLTSIGLLLSEPNPDDGLMCEASREYKYNRQAFDQKARSLTEKYAKDDARESIPSSSSHQLSTDPCKVEGSESKNELQDELKESAVVKKFCGTNRKLSLESSALVQQRDNNKEKNTAAMPHLGIFNLDEHIKVGGLKEEKRYADNKSNCEKFSGNEKKYLVESHGQLHDNSGRESTVSYHHLTSDSHTAETAFCDMVELSFNHKKTTQNLEIIDKNLRVSGGVQTLGSSHVKINGGYREKDLTNSELSPLQPPPNAPKMVLEVLEADNAELQSVKDSSRLKSDGNSALKSRKLSVTSKKRSLGLKGPLQKMEKDENGFLGPIPRLQLSNPQKSSLKNGSTKKLSLGLPTPLQEKNIDGQFSARMKRSMDLLDAKLVQVNYKQDVKQLEQDCHTTGEVDRQGTEEPLPQSVDAMIVLDSEDSEEEDNKPSRPTMLKGRKRLGNGKLKA